MVHAHIPEDQVEEALQLYRTALEDAVAEFDVEAQQEKVVAEARRLLGEDDPDALDVVVALSESGSGDSVWQLEEEIVADRLDDDFPDADEGDE